MKNWYPFEDTSHCYQSMFFKRYCVSIHSPLIDCCSLIKQHCCTRNHSYGNLSYFTYLLFFNKVLFIFWFLICFCVSSVVSFKFMVVVPSSSSWVLCCGSTSIYLFPIIIKYVVASYLILNTLMVSLVRNDLLLMPHCFVKWLWLLDD